MRGRWLAAAIVLHLAAIGALRAIPAPSPRAAAARPAEPTIEIDTEAEGASPAIAPAPAFPALPNAVAARVEPRDAPLHAPDAPRAPEPGAPPEPPASAPDDAEGGDGPPIVTARADIGLGKNHFLLPGSLPESHAPLTDGRPAPPPDRPPDDAKHRVEQALRQPARDRERELGLGPEGPVLRALGDAASAAATPVTGRAVYVAIADGAGDVVSVDLVSSDGPRAGWEEAARAALAALRGKKLRMPSTAKRAEMKIEVTSAWKLPSGHDPGVEMSVLGLPVTKGEGKNATKMELLNPLPKVVMVPITTDSKEKIPVLVWQLTIFGTNGDPSDLAAKPRRILHSRLLDSKIL